MTEHTMIPFNYDEMSEYERDQWYVKLINRTIDDATSSGKPEEWLHSLYVIKDYVWYLNKER